MINFLFMVLGAIFGFVLGIRYKELEIKNKIKEVNVIETVNVLKSLID